MPISNQPKGKIGENIAEQFLLKKGYLFVTRNFQCRSGEIDLVFIHDKTLIFVEVKTRTSAEYGVPQEAVTRWKLRKIVRAGHYLRLKQPQLPDLMRVDVVAIILNETTRRAKLEHLISVTG